MDNTNKYPQYSAIDMASLYKSELQKHKSTSSVNFDYFNNNFLQSIRAITNLTLFNMLQDMRHLMVLDVRSKEDFDSKHVRNAFWIDLSNEDEVAFMSEFLKIVTQSVKNLVDKEDEFRRLLIVKGESADCGELLEKVLKQTKAFHKVLQLKEIFESFENEYGFMCVSSEAAEDDVKRAMARYPSKLAKAKLHIGNFTNCNNKEHFKNLNIGTVIQITAKKVGKIEDSKVDKYSEFKVEETNIKFEDEKEETEKERDGILIYCINGDYSAVICMRILMKLRKCTKEIAATHLMAVRPELKERLSGPLMLCVESAEVEEIMEDIVNKYLEDLVKD